MSDFAPIAVFKTKIRFSNRGMKVISKADRLNLITCLEQLVKQKGFKNLEAVLKLSIQKKYSVKSAFTAKNIEAYVSGEVGIGMSLLTDICEYASINCSVVISLPSKEVSLVFYGE